MSLSGKLPHMQSCKAAACRHMVHSNLKRAKPSHENADEVHKVIAGKS